MNGEDHNRDVLCNIARSAFQVVSRLLARDQLVARDLRSATTGSRQIYREECITADMAATLREQFPDRVDITLFTPPEEKSTGADWYWRFERNEGAIHARVQAKRVQRTEFGQGDADGYIDLNEDQLSVLLHATNEASRELPGLEAWLATYARFVATPPCGQSDLQRCEYHRHVRACVKTVTPSLWIAHAQEIRSSLGSEVRVRVEDIIKHSLRLDCVLPCIGPAATSGPGNKGFAFQRGLKSYRDCIAAIEGSPALRKQFEGGLRITL